MTPTLLDAVDAERYRELLNQALDALSTYQGFIDDAHILEGQWHWLDDAKAADASIRAAISAPTAVEPDERAEFEAWWATMNEAPYYPGIQKRIAEHAFKAGRASKGTK